MMLFNCCIKYYYYTISNSVSIYLVWLLLNVRGTKKLLTENIYAILPNIQETRLGTEA